MPMKIPYQIPFHYLVIAIAAIIIIITVATLMSGENETDTTPPELEVITEILTAYEGETVTIEINFSDNVAVTYAKVFYKNINDKDFIDASIIEKTFNLSLPLDSDDDWEFYVIINDAAGNGPVGMPSINGDITYPIIVLEKNDDETTDNETYRRFVFVEECSSVSCSNCPDVADSLHELKDEGIDFYYVTLVAEDTEAKKRINDYNVDAYPTVLVDGGYKAFRGRKDKDIYQASIIASLNREVPDIIVKLDAENKSSEISIDTTIINNENTAYSGTLKVYLVEIVSTTLQDYKSKPYSHDFLEFAIDKEITIKAKSNTTESITISTDIFDPDNLLIYAVVFSNDKYESYLDDEKEYPFDAYYVDGCAGTQVVEGGNLPPNVGITKPAPGTIYLRGTEKEFGIGNISFHPQKPIIFGRMTFTFEASDEESSIEKVDFYIDETLVKSFKQGPYEYEYRNEKIFKWQHTIKVIAYDSEGKSSSAEREIIAITAKA